MSVSKCVSVNDELISHLLVCGFPSGINSTMANSFFHGLRHGGAWPLSVETWQQGGLQEENNSLQVCSNMGQRGRKRGNVNSKQFKKNAMCVS